MTYKPFDPSKLPQFDSIDLSKIEPTMRGLIAQNIQTIEDILATNQAYTWDNLMAPLEAMSDAITNYWSPISHLHSVKESEPLREIYNRVVPLLTEYHNQITHNRKLFNAILQLAEQAHFKQLTPAQQKIIENDIRDFKLSGVHLDERAKEELSQLNIQLSKLMTEFSENLLDATDGWYLHITNDKEVADLPLQGLELVSDNAKQKNLDGYVFTLDHPCYAMGIRYLKNRELRRELYSAYTTRASDQGPTANQWDNAPVMEAIMTIRERTANLLGFANYAAYSLATKMAKTTDEVNAFLDELLILSRPIAKAEFEELEQLAKEIDGIDSLAAWDFAYYSEILQQKKFHFNQEDVRPYFPISKVMCGMFTIINHIFGITILKQNDISVWHEDVEFYAIYDQDGKLSGGFYTDLYARKHKREGAWMDDCHIRKMLPDGTIQLPVAFLTCNFMAPVEGKEGLLTHDDVLTVFHEFGHCLHHLLTKVEYAAVSGINGVPWDAVEFPSQFMEYFCWEKESLDLISGHYVTGEPLPDSLYQQMLAAKNFQAGMHMVRQLELSIFDFRLHMDYQPGKVGQIQSMLDDVRKETIFLKIPSFNRFQNSFSHIFSGGYAAGYYSYKWAEVLSADAYSLFQEKGIFDKATGLSFKKNILEVGGVRDPMISFVAFRGRAPKIDALLKYSGIQPASLS